MQTICIIIRNYKNCPYLYPDTYLPDVEISWLTMFPISGSSRSHKSQVINRNQG